MSKIYTKSGDNGMTTLADGRWVTKFSDVIELYGTIDELSAFLGLVAESLQLQHDFGDLLKQIYKYQKELFYLTCHVTGVKRKNINFNVDELIGSLEREIDIICEKLPHMNSFILPGGGDIASKIHIARSVCRRAERVAFRAVDKTPLVMPVAVYLNRFSDWLYVIARYLAYSSNVEEITI